MAGRLTILRSSRRGQFIDVASGGDEFGRAVLAAGGEEEACRGEYVAIAVASSPATMGRVEGVMATL